jgi:hypothetical protein
MKMTVKKKPIIVDAVEVARSRSAESLGGGSPDYKKTITANETSDLADTGTATGP